jgi:undecaprenyl-diphosphatase
MHYLAIAVLAVVQGLSELLPVSSSAHVILAQRLMGFDPSAPDMTFLLVMLHTGTMFAVLRYFWPRWRISLFSDGREPRRSAARFLGMVMLATGCTGGLGLGLKILIERVILERLLGHPHGEVEALFRYLPLMAGALLAAGIMILAAARWDREATRRTIDTRQALWIGLVQGLCLPFRGFSRSGATISVGLMTGLRRDVAEEFSFALAVALTPPIIVVEAQRLFKATGAGGVNLQTAALVLPGTIGMGISFLAGLFALRWLSAWLEQGRWHWFGYYCIGFAGVVVLSYVAAS